MPEERYSKVKVMLAGLFSLSGYVFITYVIERHENAPLLFAYALLFILYLFLYCEIKTSQLNLALILALIFRLALLPTLPNLSDDFYRFIWDGRLILQGIHPFAELPSYYVAQGIVRTDSYDYFLYAHMNSRGYFTIYPPVCQAIFALAALLSPDNISGSVIFIRLLIILAETGSIYLMMGLLKKYRLPRKHVLLYALNPLVILELSGNLHFEALMLFFLLASLYFLYQKKLIITALFFSLAISTKLIPLILLPLYFSRMGFRHSACFFTTTGLFTLLLFLPMINLELIEGLSASLSLYFQKFEFNASLYYLIREIGYAVTGFNIIGIAGKSLAAATLLGIILFAYKEKKQSLPLPEAYLWTWLIYLLLATTVHPWYIIPLLAFSVFTSYRFPVVWTALIFLTYTGYGTQGYVEQLWIVGLEYAGVFGFCLYEYFNRERVMQCKIKESFYYFFKT